MVCIRKIGSVKIGKAGSKNELFVFVLMTIGNEIMLKMFHKSFVWSV